MFDDFETLSKTASSPEEFAALHSKLLARVASQAMAGTQARIDMQRWKSGGGSHFAEALIASLSQQILLFSDLAKLLEKELLAELKLQQNAEPQNTFH
jgi:hypothetical protein